MPEIAVLLCDIPDCGSSKKTARYTLTAHDATRKVILCASHAVVVNQIFAHGEEVQPDVEPVPDNRGVNGPRLLSLHRDK